MTEQLVLMASQELQEMKENGASQDRQAKEGCLVCRLVPLNVLRGEI